MIGVELAAFPLLAQCSRHVETDFPTRAAVVKIGPKHCADAIATIGIALIAGRGAGAVVTGHFAMVHWRAIAGAAALLANAAAAQLAGITSRLATATMLSIGFEIEAGAAAERAIIGAGAVIVDT